MVRQRDIVEVAFSEDLGENHPAIVISNKLVQEITSKDHDDEFSFKITDDMLVKPQGRSHSEARCHLINFVPLNAIITNNQRNQLRLDPFKDLIKKINNSTFSTEEL